MSDTQKAAVIGHPIGHTMSPFIHKRLFALSGIPMEYEVMDMPDLKEGIPALQALDCFNVTIPHKAGIIPFLDGIDPQAKEFGSVNTVKVEKGRFYGYTTDGAGCYRALQNSGLDFSGQVLLLGNGGAARALAFEIALRQPGFQLTIACRESSYKKTAALGEEIAAFARSRQKQDFLVTVMTYEELEESEERFSLLLNATSVGMYPCVGVSPVSKEMVARCSAVFDAVYNPDKTELLRIAEECNIKTVGGMEMLVYQAVAAHEIWYGSTFAPGDIKALCADARREMERLFGDK